MNEYRDDSRKCCYFHPREMVVGVCAMCLKERLLLVLASQQKTNYSNNNSNSIAAPKRALPKIFALTSLLIINGRRDHNNNYDKQQQRSDDDDEEEEEVLDSSSSGQDESFISIKFEDNGVASWDKGQISKMPQHEQQQQHCELSNWDKAKKMKSVIEHVKNRATLRWRRRIGHLFQLIKWKAKSSKGNACHVGTTKLEKGRGNVKYGWIRTLTAKSKRRT